MTFLGLEIDDTKICLMMPNRETTIVGNRHHHPLAIWRHTWHHGALACQVGREKRIYLVAKALLLGIEGDGANAILHVFIATEHLHTVCRAEIESLAIWRETRIGLKMFLRGQERRKALRACVNMVA